jgi:hypothetical protein
MNMTNDVRRARLPMVAAGFALAFSNSAALAQRTETLSTGTVVKVKLDQALSSRTNRRSDRFTARVVEGADDAGLPNGTRFEGVVTEAVRHSGDKPGVLDVEFRRIIFPNEDTRSIFGTPISLSDKSVSRDANGRLISRGSSENERWKWVGIGAGAGLLLSTLTKSDTLITTLLGAGLGYLYNETQNKKPGDVNLKAGTEIGIRMERAFAFAPDNYRSYYRSTRVDPYTGRPLDPAYDDRDDRSDRYERYDRYDRTDPNYRQPVPGDPYYREPAPRDPNYDERYPSTDRYYYRSGSAYQNGDIRLMVDGREVRFGADRPFMRRDFVMVPFAAAARAAGIPYRYDSTTRTISVRNGDVTMNVDSRIAYVEGQRRRIKGMSEIRNGVLFVPMDFMAAAMDGDAIYDANTRTVTIRSRTFVR